MGEQTSLSRSQQREQFWRRIVSGQPRSGLSVAAWCGEHGVSAPSFYVWRKRLTGQRRGAVVGNAERKLHREQLLPVEIIPSPADENASVLEIELPSQVRVRVRAGCELEFLRQVLTMLQQDSQEADQPEVGARC